MIVFTPMTTQQFADYLARAIPAFAQDKVDSGQWSAQSSLALSSHDYQALLPDGMATPDHVFLTLRDDLTEENVGMLWYGTQARADERVAYVYDFLVEPAHRHKGYGSQALRALEDEVAARGLSGIALHVFGHNTAARALYAKLGFLPTNLDLFKPVTGRSGR